MRGFIREIRRRGVDRVAIAYIAAGWLIVQILETTLPIYDVDEAVIRWVILALVVGFVPALGLAWAFEWSPGGPRSQASIDDDPGAGQSDSRKLDRAIIVVLSVAVLLFAFDEFIVERTETDTRPTIAVLPFDDMTEAGDQAYFADGLAEELLNLLASNVALRVSARTSSFSFRDAEVPIDEIARRLGVRHVVEGSVRRMGDRIRITAQLIDAEDGFHRWSQNYDASFSDIFEIQENISSQIAVALEASVLGASDAPQATDPEAYALYLEAVYQGRQGSEAALSGAAEKFERVVAIDPEYAPALANLSTVYINLAARGGLDYDEGYSKARDAALAAISAAPGYSGGYLQLAWIEQWYEGNLAAAVRNMEKALAMSPGSPANIGNAAVLLLHIGQLDKSIELAEISADRSPIDPAGHFNLGLAYQYADRLDEAAERFRRTLSLSPDYIEASSQLGLSQLLRGQFAEALATYSSQPEGISRVKGLALTHFALDDRDAADASLAELIEGWGEEWPSEVVHVYAYRGELDLAFEWLEKEYAKFGSAGWGEWKYQRLFDNLRGDPRWAAFLQRVGVSDEQLAEYDFEIPGSLL